MDQHLRQSIQSTTFFYFLIVVAITTFSQIATMVVICFADISGKENVVAASVLFPTLTRCLRRNQNYDQYAAHYCRHG